MQQPQPQFLKTLKTASIAFGYAAMGIYYFAQVYLMFH